MFSKLKQTERADEENTPTGKHFLKICIFSGLPLLILPIAIHGGLKNSASNLQISQMDIKLIFRDFLLRCDDGIYIDFVQHLLRVCKILEIALNYALGLDYLYTDAYSEAEKEYEAEEAKQKNEN